MNGAERRAHWENVYTTKGEDQVSWFQETAEPSLDLVSLLQLAPDSAIIDIGGGASHFVDGLVSRGFQAVTVLDLSEAALAAARHRLGSKAEAVTWIAADVTEWEPFRTYDLWHDRATFHFLTDDRGRSAYVERLGKAIKSGGHAIIGTFALDGPERCSGLPVTRYDATTLGATLGANFLLVDARRHEHTTPWGATQRFQFSTFRRV